MMKTKLILFLLALLPLFYSSTLLAKEPCEIGEGNLVVLLKLDDVVAAPAHNSGGGVPRNWVKVADYLESNGIFASFGIIGESLEKEDQAYFSWLKARVSRGVIEFWNHGYKIHFLADSANGEIGEFNGTTADAQLNSISKTQNLALNRFGTVLRGFGPHASAVDKHTYNQLDSFSELKYVWFYEPVDAKKHRTFVIKRAAELEAPIFKPNFEAFMKTFSRRNKGLGYIALQGHPNEWDQAGFDSFVRVINYLTLNGATFCRPSDVTELNQF